MIFKLLKFLHLFLTSKAIIYKVLLVQRKDFDISVIDAELDSVKADRGLQCKIGKSKYLI